MIQNIGQNKSNGVFKFVTFLSIVAFTLSLIIPPHSYAQTVSSSTISPINLPSPGSMVTISPQFAPPIVRGLSLYPDDPFKFDFIIDTGDNNLEGEDFKSESEKLIKYFLASLTIPEDELWVNLSPYEDDRIIPEGLSVTEMGRDLLSQDYLLKQLTASLIYPEENLGHEFWNRVYKKAYQLYGTTDIPINTFNKVWIVPDKAKVYEHNGNAFVIERHLKIMLETDYLSLKNNLGKEEFGTDELQRDDVEIIDKVSKDLIQRIIIPEIEREVNYGKNFANLRQIFNSLILATWYKRNLKESLLGRQYLDQNKITGIDIEDKKTKEKIYNQYLKAFQKGVYDFIKEEYDPFTEEVIPRKYFSGGVGVGVVTIRELDVEGGEYDLQTPSVQERISQPESTNGEDRRVHWEARNTESSEQLTKEDAETDQAMIANDVRNRKNVRLVKPVDPDYVDRREAQVRNWLRALSQEALSSEEYQAFYNTKLNRLQGILGGVIKENEWNKATWSAYQDYGGNLKWDDNFGNLSLTEQIDQLISKHSDANPKTLQLLIEGDQVIDRITGELIKNLSDEEQESFVTSIHNIGYFEGEYARVKNSKNELLEVWPDGNIFSEGYLIEDGTKRIDILTKTARERYTNRHNEPGKNSLIKLSLADFQLKTEEDLQRVIHFFNLHEKDVDEIRLKVKIGDTGVYQVESISLRELLTKSLTSEVYRAALSTVNIFNGFVQSWGNLIEEANRHYSGDALETQLNFLYGKQQSALASAILLINIPELYRTRLQANDNRKRRRYDIGANRVTNVLWRITNPWESWENHLISQSYDALDAGQIDKDKRIREAVYQAFELRQNRLSREESADTAKNVFSFFVPSDPEFQKEVQRVEQDPEEFYKEMKAQGYHFEGVVTSSGLGIADQDKTKAKEALRFLWQDLDREKTIIVSGATGNEEFDNLSGVDLVYQVAEEMGFKTMGIMNSKLFDFPIRRVDYLMTKGTDWENESELLYLYSDSMTAFTGGNQAAKELTTYMERVKDDPTKPGVVRLIRGIRSYQKNKQDSYTGTLDTDEMEKLVKTYGTNHAPGSIVIQALSDHMVDSPISSKFIESKERAVRNWLRSNKSESTSQTADQIAQGYQKYYDESLTKLVELLGAPLSNEDWNEETWSAFQDHAGNYKYNDELSVLSINEKLDRLLETHPGANRATLKTLLEGDYEVDRMSSVIIQSLSESERKQFVVAIHNYGYFDGQQARTENENDVLLGVQEFGAVNGNGYLIDFENKKVDVLTEKARERYEARHQKPGKESLVKLSLADFRLETQEEADRLIEYYENQGKNVDGIILTAQLDPDSQDVTQISLRNLLNLSLTSEQHKNALGKINVFNGFVQSWDDLIKEANTKYVGDELQTQLGFLYGKQETALSSALLLSNIPSLFRMGIQANTPSKLEQFRVQMNRATNALWRITNPWEAWDSPLVKQSYDAIGEDQIRKDGKIWEAVYNQFGLGISRFSAKQIRSMSSNLYSFFRLPHESNVSIEQPPQDFYDVMKSKGYHFEGVLTASQLGIDEKDQEVTKGLLRQAWKHLDRRKTVIVSGGVGNFEDGNLSGIDLAYEVAEEMGFKTMGIMSSQGFNFPLRKVDYLISKGINEGDEYDLLRQFSDGVTAFAGDQGEADILMSYLDDESKKRVVTVLSGVNNHHRNKAGSTSGPFSNKNFVADVVQRGGEGSRNFDAKDENLIDVIIRQAEEQFHEQLEIITLEIQEAAGNKDESQVKSLIQERLALSVLYARRALNPFMAYVLERYLRSDNFTDLQQIILNGGAEARRDMERIKQVSRFARQSLATSWVESTDRRMVHSEKEAKELIDSVLKGKTSEGEQKSKFFDKNERKLMESDNYWKPENDLANERRESEDWQKWESEGELEPVINQSKQLEGILGELLKHIVHEVGLTEGSHEISHRPKKATSTFNKINKFRQSSWGANATVADVFDLLGGRIVVSDLDALERVMSAVDEMFGFKIDVSEDGQSVSLSNESGVLRKENKFLANETNEDPYRAVQYTIRFPDRARLQGLLEEAGIDVQLPEDFDPSLHTFELQIKTQRSSTASDIFHDAVYKDILNFLPELQHYVADYNWNSLYQDVLLFAQKRGYANGNVDPEIENIKSKAKQFVEHKGIPASDQEQYMDQVTNSILEGDENRFYDLVLSDLSADNVFTLETREIVKAFFDRQLEKLKVIKRNNPGLVVPLEEASHRGYMIGAVNRELESDRTQLGWKLSDEAEGLLNDQGRETYQNRFENFQTTNKISVEQLRLHELSLEDLFSFFAASGKEFDRDKIRTAIDSGEIQEMTKIEELIVKIRTGEALDVKIMNLFHGTVAEQIAAADLIQTKEIKEAWLDRLATNQLGTVTSASILTEITHAPVTDVKGEIVFTTDNNGKQVPVYRDLGEIVVKTNDGLEFTKREMLVFGLFISAINPNSDFKDRSYRNFINSPDSAWAREIDGIMDREVVKTLILGQLRLLKERIATSSSIGSRIQVAYAEDNRRNIAVKYIRSMVKNHKLADALSDYILKRYGGTITSLVNDSRQSNNSLTRLLNVIVSNAQVRLREATIRKRNESFMSKLNSNKQKEVGRILLPLFDPLDVTSTDLGNFMSIINEEYPVYVDDVNRIKNVARKLPTVKKIIEKKAEKGYAIVVGAPGSGKSEQINVSIALDKFTGKTTFNVLDAFYESEFGSQGVSWDDFYNRYKSDMTVKEQQAAWLEKSFDEIAKGLLDRAREGKTIIFDEFDFSIGEELEVPEVRIVELVVELAKRMKQKERKVLLVLHPAGAQSDGVARAFEGMLEEGVNLRDELIDTGYLSEETERSLLTLMGISKRDHDPLIGEFQGLPAAYLGYFDFMAEKSSAGGKFASYETDSVRLWEDTLTRIEKNYAVAKKIQKPEVRNLLIDLAIGRISVNSDRVIDQQDALLGTGLLGLRDGKLIMPRIVRKAILRTLDYELDGDELTVKTPNIPEYSAVFLDEESKSKLEEWWTSEDGPVGKELLANKNMDHMTIGFGMARSAVKSLPLGNLPQMKVVGWVADDKVQAVVVETKEVKSLNPIAHITVSDDGVIPPTYSNQLLQEGYTEVDGPVLRGTVGYNDGESEHYNAFRIDDKVVQLSKSTLNELRLKLETDGDNKKSYFAQAFITSDEAIVGLDGTSPLDDPKELGGIDLNPNMLDLEVQSDRGSLPAFQPNNNFENIKIDGLYPVIINIVPVNIQIFLGENKKDIRRSNDVISKILK